MLVPPAIPTGAWLGLRNWMGTGKGKGIAPIPGKLRSWYWWEYAESNDSLEGKFTLVCGLTYGLWSQGWEGGRTQGRDLEKKNKRSFYGMLIQKADSYLFMYSSAQQTLADAHCT